MIIVASGGGVCAVRGGHGAAGCGVRGRRCGAGAVLGNGQGSTVRRVRVRGGGLGAGQATRGAAGVRGAYAVRRGNKSGVRRYAARRGAYAVRRGSTGRVRERSGSGVRRTTGSSGRGSRGKSE